MVTLRLINSSIMGGGQSIASTYRGVYNLDPSLMEFKHDFERLCLKNAEVKCLYDVYHKIDNARNNAVEIDAIFLHLDITNDFIRKLFMYTVQLKHDEYSPSTKGTVRSDMSFNAHSGGDSQPVVQEQDTGSDSWTISFDVFVYAGKLLFI